MEKFITASVTPNAATTATSRHARRRARPVIALRSGLAPTRAMTAAEVHSRRPVTAAGAIWVNSLAASPAPNWTEKTPVRTSAEGGTAVPDVIRARTFSGSKSGLLPAEKARRQGDADRGPDDQHGDVAHRQACPVLQDTVQPVRQRPGGQQGERGPRRGR